MTTIIPAPAAPAAASPPPGNEARTLCEITSDVIRATCGQCWAHPGTPCAVRNGVPGVHVARLGRAARRGLITGRELLAVLHGIGVFRLDTLIWDEPAGGAA